MKRFTAIAFLLFGVSQSGLCLAASPYYVGVKAGIMDNSQGFDNILNVGALLGYTFAGDTTTSFAVEGDFTTTLVDGDAPGNGAWDIDTLGVFGAVRAGDTAYLKLKAGLVYSDVSSGNASDTNLDAAIGFGGGWRAGPRTMFEIEYAQIANDLDFISVGFVSKF